jgi:GntR family transcriptional regulator
MNTSSSSLYERVRQDLLARITSGEFKPGDMLPSEDLLCKEYGVSRITIRRAVTDLSAQFFVTRRRGVGTIVTRRLNNRREFRLTGFFGENARLNATRLLDKSVPATADVAAALEIEVGLPVRHIRTVTHRDEQPYTFSDAYTVEPVTESSAGKVFTSGAELDRLAWHIARAEQELDAIKASALVARHLGLRAGVPIMRARRIFLSADGQPVRYTIACYHPERYRFTVDLRPGPDLATFQPNAELFQRNGA